MAKRSKGRKGKNKNGARRGRSGPVGPPPLSSILAPTWRRTVEHIITLKTPDPKPIFTSVFFQSDPHLKAFSAVRIHSIIVYTASINDKLFPWVQFWPLISGYKDEITPDTSIIGRAYNAYGRASLTWRFISSIQPWGKNEQFGLLQSNSDDLLIKAVVTFI